MAVIACENAINATDTLAEFIIENTPESRRHEIQKRARFANSAIDRIVPAQDPDAGLDVTLEKFSEWVVDKTPFAEFGPPSIEGVKWVNALTPYIERKLFTVNTGHAAAAYHGYHYNKNTVYDALQDKRVLEEVRKALAETSNLIETKHHIDAQEQKDYVEKIIKRISNPHLEDTTMRVGRAPLRKLGRKERFIGPASELAEKKQEFSALLDAAEMAFRFQNVPDDEESAELAKIMSEKQPKEIVETVCEVEEGHPLFSHLVKVVQKVQAEA